MQLGPECHDLFATGSQTHLEVLQALARERGMTLTAGCVNLCFRFGGDRLAPALPNSRATWTAVSEMKTCWTQCEHPAVRSSVARPVSSASPVPPLAIEERARNEEGHAQENADPESHCCEAIRFV